MDGDNSNPIEASAGDTLAPSPYAALLKRLVQWSPDSLVVLIYIDLRNLRDINRLAGPAEGDRVIRQVEQQLRLWGGSLAVTGRLWSNEFIAAKAIDHTQGATDEAADLLQRLGELAYASAVGPARINAALGLSLVRQGDEWPRVIAQAQQACDHAKRRGLNQIAHFAAVPPGTAQPGFSAQAVADFRQLLNHDQLTLHAQPIVDIRGPEPRLAKAEFLIRMQRDGVCSPLPPGTIEALEHFGLAAELDRFSSAFVLDWLDDHRAVLDRLDNLSMNLSAQTLVDGRFMQALFGDIRNARLPHGKLCLEITETAAVQHLEVAAEIITAFKQIGCIFSLDDFGSGLCSFGYLNALPVEEVKIDGSFVRDVARTPVAREIVRAIHQVAKATGKKTVAEFVDDPRKLEALRGIGVDYAQGWLFHRAMSTEKLLELLPR